MKTKTLVLEQIKQLYQHILPALTKKEKCHQQEVRETSSKVVNKVHKAKNVTLFFQFTLNIQMKKAVMLLSKCTMRPGHDQM